MRVLILGNGFDLDHGLPTSYKNFLEFCNAIIDSASEQDFDNYKITTKQVDYLKAINKSPEIKNTFMSLIRNNRLIKYFNNKTYSDNWIDFESEIKTIVCCFRGLEETLKKLGNISIDISINHSARQILKDMDMDRFDYTKIDDTDLKAIHVSLLQSLADFTSALDYYVATFVNSTPVNGVSPDIIEFNADKVLTFNYSNTYERIYSGTKWNDKPIYAHGFANGDLNNDSNIILGITSDNDSNLYAEFEKYYQRIIKKAGDKYREWFSISERENQQIDVLFFGHSLDSSDSDIIMDILKCPHAHIKILYHNDDAYKRIVLNIIGIIGKEKLVNYVSGKNPKIEFVKQRKHLFDSTAGVEISKDIRKIGFLYEMNQKSIDCLFKKITDNIKTKNTTYFFSQPKAISLADALFSIGYYTYDVNCFSRLCDELNYETDKKGKLIRYDYSNWNKYDYFDNEIPCNTNTKSLITKINDKNEKRFNYDSKKTPLSKIKEASDYKEIIKILDDLLSKNPTEKRWKELYLIIDEMVGEESFDRAVRNMDKKCGELSKRSRILHFIAAYDEENYNYQMNKAMLESYVIED